MCVLCYLGLRKHICGVQNSEAILVYLLYSSDDEIEFLKFYIPF